MSSEVKTRLMQFINSFYWTPSRLFRVKQRDIPESWRCKESDGTLVHLSWLCLKVQDFRAAVHENITFIIGDDIRFSPSQYNLGES